MSAEEYTASLAPGDMDSLFPRLKAGFVVMSQHQTPTAFEAYLKLVGDHLLSLSRAAVGHWTAFALAFPGISRFFTRSALVLAIVCLVASSVFLGRCIAWTLVFLIGVTLRVVRRGFHRFRLFAKAITPAPFHTTRGEHLPSPLAPFPSRASPGQVACLTGSLTAEQVGLPPSAWTYGLIPDTVSLKLLKTRPDIARARRDGPLWGLGQVGWEVSRLTEVARGGTGRIRTYEVDGREVSWGPWTDVHEECVCVSRARAGGAAARGARHSGRKS